MRETRAIALPFDSSIIHIVFGALNDMRCTPEQFVSTLSPATVGAVYALLALYEITTLVHLPDGPDLRACCIAFVERFGIPALDVALTKATGCDESERASAQPLNDAALARLLALPGDIAHLARLNPGDFIADLARLNPGLLVHVLESDLLDVASEPALVGVVRELLSAEAAEAEAEEGRASYINSVAMRIRWLHVSKEDIVACATALQERGVRPCAELWHKWSRRLMWEAEGPLFGPPPVDERPRRIQRQTFTFTRTPAAGSRHPPPSTTTFCLGAGVAADDMPAIVADDMPAIVTTISRLPFLDTVIGTIFQDCDWQDDTTAYIAANAALFAALPPAVTRLDLSGCDLISEGLSAVSEALKSTSIKHLNIANNSFGFSNGSYDTSGLAALTKSIGNLKELNISSNHLQEERAKILVPALEASRSLSKFTFGDGESCIKKDKCTGDNFEVGQAVVYEGAQCKKCIIIRVMGVSVGVNFPVTVEIGMTEADFSGAEMGSSGAMILAAWLQHKVQQHTIILMIVDTD